MVDYTNPVFASRVRGRIINMLDKYFRWSTGIAGPLDDASKMEKERHKSILFEVILGEYGKEEWYGARDWSILTSYGPFAKDLVEFLRQESIRGQSFITPLGVPPLSVIGSTEYMISKGP